MQRAFLSKSFLLLLIAFVLYACFKIFEPFLSEILAATILVSIFYRPYNWLTVKLGGRRNLASFLMCILVSLLVVIPIVNFIVYSAQRAIETYPQVIETLNSNDIGGILDDKNGVLGSLDFLGIDEQTLKEGIIEAARKMRDWAVSGATDLIRGTTSFIISLILIVFTMFFFFADGEKMLQKLMYWTPLPNKYDKEIFKKFRQVSYSIVVSTFLTAIAQGLTGAIAFMIVGLPAFFAGVAIAFLALLPYIGAAVVWLPAGIFLLLTGQIWQGIFMLAWGGLVISNIDNLLRAYLIKGNAQVHPIFIIFSILGGISLFGFWGVIFGPLIISLAITVLHIYELEYEDTLEK